MYLCNSYPIKWIEFKIQKYGFGFEINPFNWIKSNMNLKNYKLNLVIWIFFLPLLTLLISNSVWQIHHFRNLVTKHYGPLRVFKRVRKMAYKLELSIGTQIYDVFHVSLPKKHHRTHAILQEFPVYNEED